MAKGNAKHAFGWTAILVAIAIALPVNAEAKEKVLRKKDVERLIPEGEYDLNGRHVSSLKKPSRRPAKATARAKPPARRPAAKRPIHPTKKTSTARNSRAHKRSIPSAKTPRRGFASTPKRLDAKKKKSAHRGEKRFVGKPAKRIAPSRAFARSKNRSRPTERKRSFAKKPSSRIPYARPTSNERDMPFVSIPKSKVRNEHKTIVMEDPAAVRNDPEGPSQNALPSPETGTPAADPAMMAREAPSYSEPVTPPAQQVAPAAAPEAVGNTVHEPDAFDLHSGADPMRPAGPAPAAVAPAQAAAPESAPAIAPIQRPSP
jgi:hypothetical protein